MVQFLPPSLDLRRRRSLKVGSRSLRAAEAWEESLLGGGQGQPPPPPLTVASRRSLAAVGLVVGGIMILLIGQLANLQLVNGKRLAGLAEGNRLRERVTYAPRGRILDRHGNELATNTASFQLIVYPYLLPSAPAARQSVYQQVAAIAGLSKKLVQAAAEDKGLSEVQPQLVTDRLTYERALRLEQRLPQLPGWSVDGVPMRRYVSDSGLAHILGYVGRVSAADLATRSDLLPIDFVGRTGVEAQYDQLVRGQDGIVQTEVDALGRPLRTLRSVAVKPGQDVRLTLDLGLQRALARAVEQQLKIAKIDRGSAVAIDPNTGEVLALVSLPGYDNNLFARGISSRDYQRLLADPLAPLYNQAIGGGYPSGSVIKPMHLAGALQEGVVNEETIIVDNGKLVVPSVYDPSVIYTFRGWVPGGLGPMNARRAVAMSSDIYFYTVGGGFEGFRGLGVDRLTRYYREFGFGRPTGIDLPGETAGRVPTPAWKKAAKGEDWFVGDTYNISIGQGDLLVSPLQMAVATAAVINDGKVLQPYLMAQSAAGFSNHPRVANRVPVDRQYLRVAMEGMRQVIGGTVSPAIFARVPVPVAGKSGTAETDPTVKRRSHAWFTAFAPYDKPEVLVAVLLEEGNIGSVYAGPVAAAGLEWYFRNR
ncbi:penicillin-binding protein 2 [Candidatus Microgenomates bacterium]|nr:penicillin-binding protein 2 [Candidatus Microgenomates bacterium]